MQAPQAASGSKQDLPDPASASTLAGSGGAGSQTVPKDLAQEAFELYSSGNFQESVKLMQTLEQQIDKQAPESTGAGAAGVGGSGMGGAQGQLGQAAGSGSQQGIISVEEKKQRVQHNMVLAEYFKARAKDPYGLLEKLIELHDESAEGLATPAPAYSVNSNKAAAGTAEATTAPEKLSDINLLLSLQQSPTDKHSTLPQASSLSAGPGGINNSQSQQPGNRISDINSILIYNIAAMSYQTQQYGQALLYIKLLLENMNQVEEFIQVKSLFLALQILFELKMGISAKPIMDLLDIKMKEIEKTIEQKQMIKNQQSASSDVSSINKSSNNSVQAEQRSADAESNSWTTTGSIYEVLDESIINKNSFCIIIGASIRRNAVSPKTVNLYELSMMLNSYKAMFNFLQSGNSTREGETFISKAFDHKGNFSNDLISFKEEINLPAVAQHLGMLTHLKAWSFVKRNAIHKCVKTLWIDEKDAISGGKPLQTHQNCQALRREDEVSRNDLVYQKSYQTHPQYYFNNMGIVHMKLKKYNMAIYYLSKAVKFLDKSNDKYLNNPNIQKNAKINPNENLGTATSQKSHEIIFNYGLALFKSNKYYEAFKCFEKVSLGVLRQNPKLWYYMGLCSLQLNKDLYRKSQRTQSEVYHEMLGNSIPTYVKSAQKEKERRFILTPSGDPISKMEQEMKDFEQNKIKDQKKFFVEIQKQINHDQIQSLSKTKQKKFETTALQNYSQTNSTLGLSLSLDNAIMYMQDVLSVIEHKIQNEIRYSLHFKQIVGSQIVKLDLTQQQFHDELKSSAQGAAAGGSIVIEDQSNTQSSPQTKKSTPEETSGTRQQILQALRRQVTPQSQAEYEAYCQEIRSQIEKRYENLIKNAHQYLSYMYLISYNFQKCISHGKKLLDFLKVPDSKLAPTTQYNAHMYIAEAYCMIGKFQESLSHLEKAEEISEEASANSANIGTTNDNEGQQAAQNLVEKVELKFRTIPVKPQGSASEGAPPAQQKPEELLTVKIINKLNKCVVDICAGHFDQAREKLDEVITNSEEAGGLGLKEITCDSDSNEMLPAYLVTLLTYFYLRVKNLKMAKALIKSRRFVVDTDHIVQQVKHAAPAAAAGQQQNAKYSKKASAMMNYKSIAKNFT